MSDARPAQEGRGAPVELVRALAVLAEPPDEAHARLTGLLGLGPAPDPAAFTEVFVLQLPPYASVHLGPEGMLGGEARGRVAGFWRAVGHTPPTEPDHLAALLGLWAALHEAGGASRQGDAESVLARTGAETLLLEHLAPWVFGYLTRVRELGVAPFDAWARTLEEALAECVRTAAPLPLAPLHLRDVPPLPDPRVDGGPAFLEGLLAPVRSGMIVTRHTLSGLARNLGLGVRLGERRYVLENLLGQDPAGVLRALAGEAERQSGEHAARRPLLGETAAFHEGRARRAAELLTELADEPIDAAAATASTRG